MKKYIQKIITILFILIMLSCKINDSQYNAIKKDEYGNVIEPAINMKKNEMSLKTIQTNENTLQTINCIIYNIQNQFKLNTNFIKLTSYDNNAKSIKIYNPYNGTEGITIDIIPEDIQKNTIKLYANGIPKVSKAWLNIIESCKKN